MFRDTLRMLVIVMVIAPALAHAQQEGKRNLPESRVKTSTRGLGGVRWVKGVVDKIDDDSLTLVETDEKTGEVRDVVYAPTDVLRASEVMEHASGRFSYRWQDVKRGDTLELEVNRDHIDKVMYCVEICIWKRPKDKLPKCQRPDDYEYFPHYSMFNDIDNGEDVSDDEIKKLFPPRPEKKDQEGKVTARAYPGGLPKEYQKKLDAIRAKKKDDPKATPPEKK